MSTPPNMRLMFECLVMALLGLVIFVAFAGTIATQQNVRVFTRRYQQLTGELPLSADFAPSEFDSFKVLRLTSDDPQRIQWRVRKPIQVSCLLQLGFPDSRSNRHLEELLLDHSWSYELQPYVHFQLDDQLTIAFINKVNVAVLGETHGTQWQIRDPRIAKLLREHWQELEFEIAGDSQALELEETEILTLLKVRAPQRLLADPMFAGCKDGTILWIRMGTPEQIQRLLAERSEGTIP